MKKKKISQKELVFQYYLDNPNRDIHHNEIVPIVMEQWEKRMKKPFKDPDRTIRTLYQEGKLIKVRTSVYRYDPNYEGKGHDETFSPKIKEAIFKRDNYKCVYCGHGVKEGEELHADHIKPRSKGGKSTLENGQTLCSRHNMLKKNLNQTETGKKMFIKIYELSKKEGHEHTRKFAKEVLDVFEKYDINGHITWEE